MVVCHILPIIYVLSITFIRIPFFSCQSVCHILQRENLTASSNSVCQPCSVETFKDLGVQFDSKLTFDGHIQEKINKAYSVLGIIKRNFIYVDKSTFILLYKAMVRPHIEYAHSVWNPFFKGNIDNIEKVQKRATKLVISLKHLRYKERLEQLKLPTLKYRRARGDMIEVWLSG